MKQNTDEKHLTRIEWLLKQIRHSPLELGLFGVSEDALKRLCVKIYAAALADENKIRREAEQTALNLSETVRRMAEIYQQEHPQVTFLPPTKEDKKPKPLRNCDVGTVDEQLKSFRAFCSKSKDCSTCPIRGNGTSCTLAWAQLPYEETK